MLPTELGPGEVVVEDGWMDGKTNSRKLSSWWRHPSCSCCIGVLLPSLSSLDHYYSVYKRRERERCGWLDIYTHTRPYIYQSVSQGSAETVCRSKRIKEEGIFGPWADIGSSFPISSSAAAADETKNLHSHIWSHVVGWNCELCEWVGGWMDGCYSSAPPPPVEAISLVQYWQDRLAHARPLPRPSERRSWSSSKRGYIL